MKEEEKDNEVNEPGAEYKSLKKTIRFFNSFEEAAEADYEFYRNLTPEQRMEIHFELSIRVFDPIKGNSSKRFSF